MPDSAPTHVRYRVIAVCSLMAVLLYLDRFCVSFAEVFIKEDLQLSAGDASLLFVAFFITYALGQTPSGWLADRFGGRRMLTLFILSWSLFTGLLGLANGVIALTLLRMGMGFAQAGAFPTAASMITKWVPLTSRGVASSLVALGGRIGGALSLFITGYVILYFVPTAADSTLQPRDLLRPERLAYELQFGSLPVTAVDGEGGVMVRVGQRILNGLDTETRVEVVETAARYRDAARQAARIQLPTGEAGFQKLKTDLAQGLNQVLAQPEFFSAEELQDVKLEHEAKHLLKQSPGELTASEVERMNRLVLEALYPQSIKKVYGAGWRSMTFLYGLMGLPVALLFWIVCRDEPRQHPRLNESELELIERNRPRVTAEVRHLPLLALATSRTMWFNGAMQFFTNVGWVFLMTYLPRYLIEVHRVPMADRAWMSTVPTLVAIGGMFCGGFLTDRMTIAMGKRWGRSLPIAVTRFAAAGAYLFCLLEPSPWVAVGLLAAAAFFCDLGIPAVWAFQQDVGGKHAGSVLGWGNMWGNFGAAVGPYVIARLAGSDQNQNWNAVFITCAAAFLLSGIVALGVNANQQVVPES